RLRCFKLTNAHYKNTCFPDTGSQSGVVTVRRNNAETIYLSAVQQVHGVNNQGTVSSIFTYCVTELLYGLNSMVVQRFFPAGHLRSGPAAVNSPDRNRAILSGFC